MKSRVRRYESLFGVQPHRRQTFKLSSDPLLVDRVHDIVGLYLNPPDNALVLCVDEKSQVQALERSQPILPMGLGYPEPRTHDHKRHGTTSLFDALNIATGVHISQCKPRHRHQEYLSFLRQIGRGVPKPLDVHLIVDNYATHKHAPVRVWLAGKPHYHMHCTPTYVSWLNQVERRFGIITQQAIRRGSFSSVKDSVNRIGQSTRHYNAQAQPFVWTATGNSRRARIARRCAYISGTSRSAGNLSLPGINKHSIRQQAFCRQSRQCDTQPVSFHREMAR